MDAPQAVKACPMCGETILAVAKKCKHCGEVFGERPIHPGVAALISFIVPGGGQMAAGGLGGGLFILVAVIALFVILPPLGGIAHLLNVIHAYTFAVANQRV